MPEVLFSKTWWISALVAGLLFSILATYFVRGIDRAGRGLAQRWTLRSKARRQRYERLVHRAANYFEREQLERELAERRHFAAMCLLMAGWFLVAGIWLGRVSDNVYVTTLA